MQLLDERFDKLLVVLALESDKAGDVRIACLALRVCVLRESSHLGGMLRAVEADDLFEHQGVRHAVRDVPVGTQLMRHRVADAEECVRKRHTCHCGRICHALTRLCVVAALLVCAGQIIKDELDRFLRNAVGEVGRHDGCDRLERVAHCVDTRAGGKSLGNGHHEIGVDDRHIGHEFVVSKRILGARLLVGDDRERRHFRTGTCRRGNSDEQRLVAHVREGIDTLADIHKAHRHILEIYFGVLIHDPHDLCSIHGRTAADRDDDVGLEVAHLLDALVCAGKRGIGRDVEEGRVRDALLVENARDLLGETALEQELVGDDERLLLVIDLVTKLLEGDTQATAFEIDLLRCSEPQHIFLPFRNGLDIDEVLDAHVLGDGVAAPRTAAQREGCGELEVVKITDAAMRGRRVDDDTAGLHDGAEVRDLVRARLHVDIQ